MDNLGGLSNEIGSIYEDRETKTQQILQSVVAAATVGGVVAYFIQAYTGKLTSEHFSSRYIFDSKLMLVKNNYSKLAPDQVNEKLLENIQKVFKDNQKAVTKIIESAANPADPEEKTHNLLRKLIQIAADSDEGPKSQKVISDIAQAITIGGSVKLGDANSVFKSLELLNSDGSYSS